MKRGRYAKSHAKREEILGTALRIIAQDGYRRATVRQIADTMGISTTSLLHHFGTKDALLTEVLQRRDMLASRAEDGSSLIDSVATRFAAGLPELVQRNTAVPGLVQLYARLAAEAVDPAHHAHEYFIARYAKQREIYTRVIAEEQAHGRLDDHLDAATLAVALIALIDGLQMQWLYDPETAMADILTAVLGGVVGTASTAAQA